MLRTVVDSLVNGGIPASPDMMPIMLQAMNMLSLTEAGTALLLESGFLSAFFNMIMDSQYFKYAIARRQAQFDF
jgi:hypothetical protein